MDRQMQQGFTLLELSIVLVIIGLIIGGITAGSDLIRAAEYNGAVSDINKYKLAVKTFKLKYNAVPADLKNASSYWPSCYDNGTNYDNATSSPKSSCDGNGNGLIDYDEWYYFWDHLSRAELVEGNYERSVTSGFPTPLVLDDPIYAEGGAGLVDNTGAIVRIIEDNVFIFLAPANLLEEATYFIDVKMDDGKPHTGRVILTSRNSAGCLAPGGENNYDLTFSGNFNNCNTIVTMD